MACFEAFKETNERLTSGRNDVVLKEKLARINGAIDAQARGLDEIALKAAQRA